MFTSCLIGFILIFAYCVAIIIKDKKIPNSISHIVYFLDKKWKWTFTAVMFAISFLIVPQLINVVADKHAFLSFLTIVGILGVGSDPLEYGKKNIVHYASAFLMGVVSQIIVYLYAPKLMFLWIPYVIYTLYETKSDKNMFFAEMVMIISLGVVCLI